MHNVIISFPNDARKQAVAKSLFNAYPNSIVNAHAEVFPESNEIELEMSYADFCIILNMIKGKVKQWEIPKDIYQIAYKYGLVNDDLHSFKNILNNKRNDTLTRIDTFLKSPDTMFIPDIISDYLEYKEIFARQKNIIPVQVVFDKVINIYGGVPIYAGNIRWDKSLSTLEEHNITLNGDININAIRATMLLQKYGDEESFFFNDVNKKFFSRSEIEYLESCLDTLCDIVSDDQGDNFVRASNITYPENLFRLTMDQKTCDKIIRIVKQNKSYHKKVKSHSHISRAVAIPEDELQDIV
uniref:Uncharacterized protein n=1 Tax=viral metagenome TaxID=1070528 RepID=A0A6C0CBM2_9ZZZZ